MCRSSRHMRFNFAMFTAISGQDMALQEMGMMEMGAAGFASVV